MKNKLSTNLAILGLAFSGVFSLGLHAQTTDEGPGPSEQPSAPMEMGQPQAPPQDQRPPDQQPPYAGQRPQPGQPGQGQQTPQMDEAQPGGPSGEGPAKTDQGVGRISMIHGDVSTQRGDSGTWSAAVLNQPVVNGDKVSTGAGGRAEVQLDYANILRLGNNAQANIANFTHKYIQIQVGQGLANYSVFGESEAEPEIDTPNVSVHPAHQDGVYRIEVQPDGDSVVIVRKGEAEISTPQGIAEVKQGEMATVRGAGVDARYKIGAAPDRDDWDRWNVERDHMIHNANSWRHTNRYYTGSEDLDAYGRWQNVPDYGDVWVPNEPGDWAPYRDGNWVYEPYYGWTWVGYEPWGWARYHYGRWMLYGGAWAWWPGPVWGWYRPFWAPAYVSFFGWGGGFGFGFGWGGWGGFGWLPLGPCDWFHPWWGGYGGRFGWAGRGWYGGRWGGFAPLHSGTRFSNVAHLSDPRIGRGLSTVAAGRFGAGRVRAVSATRAQISGARMMTGNLPVVPSRASLSASGRAAAPSTIHSGAAQHFFGSQSSSHPESFQEQTAHLQQSMQQSHTSPVTAGARAANSSSAEGRGSAASRGAIESRGGAESGRLGAGTAANRGTENGAGRSTGNESRGLESGNRPSGPTTFANRPESAPSSSKGSEMASSTRGEPNRSEWKTFTPPAHNNESAGRRATAQSSNRGDSGTYNRGESGSSDRGGNNSYWSRTAPSSNSARGSSSSGYERGGSSRPQLNMRQPIAQPRSSGGYGGYRGSPYGGGYGGYHGAPSYGGGSHSAPGYGSGGSHSSGGGHSSGSGGGSHR